MLHPFTRHLLTTYSWASLEALRSRIQLPMQETQARSLGQGDPLEKGMATHASILAWKIPWTKEPSGLQSMGSQKSYTQLSRYTTGSGSILSSGYRDDKTTSLLSGVTV